MTGWHAALAYALTGERLDLPASDLPDAAALARDLADRGWTPERLAEHAASARDAGRPWPHPIPDALRAGLGAAQLHAALASAREALGVAGLDERSPAAARPLNADERRLLAEVPPHHVAR